MIGSVIKNRFRYITMKIHIIRKELRIKRKFFVFLMPHVTGMVFIPVFLSPFRSLISNKTVLINNLIKRKETQMRSITGWG